MTKEKLDRIKKAYSSGLKVQIWFNGYWEGFDIRDYSMYSEPFSENRQYRIVGSDYADIAENRIADLERENRMLGEHCNQLLKDKEGLTDKIEKMKCCGNCSHFRLDKSGLYPIYVCELTYPNRCKNHDKWEIKEND
jgi:hypothetical protein